MHGDTEGKEKADKRVENDCTNASQPLTGVPSHTHTHSQKITYFHLEGKRDHDRQEKVSQNCISLMMEGMQQMGEQMGIKLN